MVPYGGQGHSFIHGKCSLRIYMCVEGRVALLKEKQKIAKSPPKGGRLALNIQASKYFQDVLSVLHQCNSTTTLD